MQTTDSKQVKTQELIPLPELLKYRITENTDVPEEVPIIKIRDKQFLKYGGLGAIMGKPKAGKSTLIETIVTLALADEPLKNFDSLDMEVAPAGQKNIIIFDTEQSQGDVKESVQRVLKNLGKNTEERLYHIYLRQEDYAYRRRAVFSILEQVPNVHLVIIDGFADMVKDPVTAVEDCKTFVRDLLAYTDTYNTAILGAIHENYDNAKIVGHLGSEIEKKANGILKVIKHDKGEYHEFRFHFARKAANFAPVYFKKSDEGKSYQISEGEAKSYGTSQEDRKSQKLVRIENYCREIFKEAKELPKETIYGQLKSLILWRESDTYKDPKETKFKTYVSTIWKDMIASVLSEVKGKPDYWAFTPV